MVIPQDKFFVRVEPGPTLDTVAVSVQSLIPYPVEVRFKRFQLERNPDSSGYDKHEGLFRKKIRFPCRIEANSNPLFLGLLQEFKCRSLRPGIITPVVGVRLTRLTHGRDPNSSGYDVQMVIPQDKFFVRVEPGTTLDTVAVSVQSIIPYPVEVRMKRFWLERNPDSSGYDKHGGLFRKKIRFPCRIEANSNPLFFWPFSRIQMSQSSSGHNISCCRSPIDAFDTWT